MSRSGLYRVKVYNRGMPAKSGRGLFAAAFTDRFPLLPVEEEGRLHDTDLRENFIERVFACHDWHEFLKGPGTPGELVLFHSRRKLLLMAHSPNHYRLMGALVAQAGTLPRSDLLSRFEELFMSGMACHATPAKNVNVLHHIAGYFRKYLTPFEKQELLQLIENYRNRLIPLIVPITLLRHYVAKYPNPWLQEQIYLSPHPAELMLRNHV